MRKGHPPAHAKAWKIPGEDRHEEGRSVPPETCETLGREGRGRGWADKLTESLWVLGHPITYDIPILW